MAQCRCRVKLATMLPSHAGDGAAEATWPRCDVEAESCWQQCCCHTQFLCQNQVLNVRMTQDQLFHTYSQKCSQITKYHE
jgi:hypothetical protein